MNQTVYVPSGPLVHGNGGIMCCVADVTGLCGSVHKRLMVPSLRLWSMICSRVPGEAASEPLFPMHVLHKADGGDSSLHMQAENWQDAPADV